MPRDPAGNFTLYSPGNPVVTNTTIASAWANNTLSDIGTAMTDSLSRSGLGGMLTPFKLVDGSASAPAFAFQSESNTGLYRAGAFNIRLAIGGADIFSWTTGGFVGIAPNGHGLTATGTGLGSGVSGVFSGASIDPFSVAGVQGFAVGVAAGVYGEGQAVGAPGLSGRNTAAGLGLYAQSSATNIDVARIDGYVDLSHAANPSATTGFANRLTPKNVPKAYCSAFINAGTVTVRDAFNVQAGGSWTLGALGDVTIPFATAMGDTNYTVAGVAYLGQPLAFYLKTKNTGSLVINVMTFAAPGTPLHPTTDQFSIDFTVMGAQ